MSKPKITPTFNDRAANGSGGLHGMMTSPAPFSIPPMHIEAAHEPLSGEAQEKKVEAIQEAALAIPPVAPVVEPAPLKIALVGTAPSSRLLAPFSDPSWKIWSCSPGNMNTIPRVDVWFEIHQNLHWPENKHYGDPYIHWLKEVAKKIPVYMQDKSYVEDAVPYPKEEMTKLYGKDFFTSSFAWMMAMAISQGAKEIALFGIDMASRDEYILQRPGFYFFKFIAEQKGIKVWAPNESDIMQPPGLYGFSDSTPFGRKILARETEIKGRLEGMKAERAKLDHNITYLEGAVEDVDYFKSIWIGQG